MRFLFTPISPLIPLSNQFIPSYYHPNIVLSMPVFYVKYQKISSLYNKIYLIKDTEIKLRLKKYGCNSRIFKTYDARNSLRNNKISRPKGRHVNYRIFSIVVLSGTSPHFT